MDQPSYCITSVVLPNPKTPIPQRSVFSVFWFVENLGTITPHCCAGDRRILHITEGCLCL
jgi:hypothetical protein